MCPSLPEDPLSPLEVASLSWQNSSVLPPERSPLGPLERTDPSSRPVHTGSPASLPPATPSFYQQSSSIPPFPAEWAGRSVLVRTGFSLVPRSRQNRPAHPSPRRKDLAPRAPRRPGPLRRAPPASPPDAAHRVLGHGEEEVSLAVVLNLRDGPLMALQQDRLLWGQDGSVSAQDRPLPPPRAPTAASPTRQTHHPRGDTRRKGT